MLLLFIFTDLRHVLTFNFILIFWTLATTSDSIFWSLNWKVILQSNNSIILYSLTRGTHFHMTSTVLIIKYFMIDFIIKFLWEWLFKNITANLTLEINISFFYLIMIPVLFFYHQFTLPREYKYVRLSLSLGWVID